MQSAHSGSPSLSRAVAALERKWRSNRHQSTCQCHRQHLELFLCRNTIFSAHLPSLLVHAPRYDGAIRRATNAASGPCRTLAAELSPIEGSCGSGSVARHRAEVLLGNYNHRTIHLLVTVTESSELCSSPIVEQHRNPGNMQR